MALWVFFTYELFAGGVAAGYSGMRLRSVALTDPDAMGNRPFTRFTNGFSEKVANHEHALASYYIHYNFGRIHKSLRVTPAMEARIADHVWCLEGIASLAE